MHISREEQNTMLVSTYKKGFVNKQDLQRDRQLARVLYCGTPWGSVFYLRGWNGTRLSSQASARPVPLNPKGEYRRVE